MANLGGWIHTFAVTETQTHKSGYTIYKITSIVFPRSIPQALTCLTIWKRFHDVKRLHRELARRHKSLQLPGKLPEPTDSSFFKRFDAGIIRKRKEYILQLLDFAAMHPALYKCHAFAQFFSENLKVASTPKHNSSIHHLPVISGSEDANKSGCGGEGVIAEICDKFELSYDAHDGLTLLDPECDKLLDAHENNEINNADNVSITSITLNDPNKSNGGDMETMGRPCKDYTRFLTPMASIESDDSDYIYEAALEFSHAVEAEANLEYKEAHARYKHGVEVLLNGAKDDANDERKFIAKTKIAKYLVRADDIYERFLSNNFSDSSAKTNLQLAVEVRDASDGLSALYLERPWNHLAKYKVMQVLGQRVMQVRCITEAERPLYIIKGIEKPSSNTPTQRIFLPQHIPYMVELLAFFQSEQKLFLLLKQAEGGRLYDYIQSYIPTVGKTSNYSGLFPEVYSTGDSNNESVLNLNADSPILSPSKGTNEFPELVRSSQQLLASVSNALKELRTNQDQYISHSSSDATQILSQIHTNAKEALPEVSLKQWARELAVAIQSLHAKGIILSDLHMDNLLLGTKGQLLISYFYQNEGFTSSDNYMHKSYSPLAVAGHFVAPERPLTFRSDWWSYGVVLYQLLLGLSFKSAHPGHIDLYGCVQYPENVQISEEACDLLDNLLQKSPEERYNYEQIQTHSWFAGTNWEEVRQNGLNCNNNTTTSTDLIARI